MWPGDDELIRYLEWHGVHAGAVVEDQRGGSIAAQILDRAKQTHVGLLVMGAYTHSRLREAMFGGITRDVLASAEIPVLLAH